VQPEIVLRIDALAAGGDGVGRAPDGRVVFVPFTAPGDQVRVRVEQSRRRFAKGRVTELLAPGPGRVTPPCGVFGRCGGCSWQHLEYPIQLAAKRRILADALERIGGLSLPEPPPITPSPRPYGYRLRARVLVENGRVGYRERSSHVLCAVESCPVLMPELDARLAALAAGPPPADGDWELTCAGGDARALPLAEDAAPEAAPHPVPEAGTWDAPHPLQLEVAGEQLRFSPGVFTQANAALLTPLVEQVVDAVGEGERLLELFAGSGLFTLALARRFGRMVAVEASPLAASDLRENLARAGLARVEVLAIRVEDLAVGRVGFEPEVVLLDPPRAGLSARALEGLVGMAPVRIVYLSCDPATLARDLRALGERGYRLRAVSGLDLFPQTSHVEALAVLEQQG